MINNTHYTQHSRSFSFIDRLYNFYFLDHKNNIVLYLYDFIICMLYIAINVMVFGRNEDRSIYEGIIISALIIIAFPIIYCIFIYDKKIENDYELDQLFTFYAIFYRRTKTRSKSVRWKVRKKYRPHNVVYMSDTRMHSNILYE
jgi:hypothetical protein